MTRQKNVYNTSEIAHLWAHKIQANARNTHGNFDFDGDVIYSYGSHFPIARHIETSRGPAILFTTRTYSITTSKHLHMVSCAIPNGVPVFNLPDVGRYSAPHPQAGYDYHVAEVKDALQALDKARNKASKAIKFQALELAVQHANEYRDYFYPRRKAFNLLPKGHKTTVDEYRAMVEARFQASAERTRTASARRNAAWAARDAQRTADAQARAERMPELIQAWRDGSNPRELDYWTLNGLPIMLRLDGAEVETSKGARVPVKHALILLNIVHKVRNIGEPWHRNGRTIHVGHYELDAIAPDGTVTAGCHVITWDEIARFEPILKAAVPMPEDSAVSLNV